MNEPKQEPSQPSPQQPAQKPSPSHPQPQRDEGYNERRSSPHHEPEQKPHVNDTIRPRPKPTTNE